MKLRNKLVAVMAASMVMTSVPVITMADSSNSLSVYNYKIKDSMVGFTTTDHMYNVGTTPTTGSTYYTNGARFNADSSSLPKLEISPEYNYDLGATTQTAFLHLTTDSSFVKEAYVLYVDALNAAGHTSSAYFDKAGKVQGTQFGEYDATTNPTGWDGRSADDIINAGLLKVSFSVVSGQNFATPVAYSASLPSVTIKPMDITEKTLNDRKYKSTIRMDFNGTFTKGTTYPVAFLAKVGGDKEVLAYLDGNDSFVSSKTFSLTGVLTDKKLVATSDSKTITTDNIEEIGEIRLDESQIGALTSATNRYIKIKLPSSADLEFNLSKTKANITAEGKRGFYGQKATDLKVVYGKEARTTRTTTTNLDDDNQVLLIELPNWSDPSAYGQVVLKGIYVEPQDKTAATGDVKITLSEDLTQGNGVTADSSKTTNLVASTELKVATVADYGVTIESTPIDIKAGRSGVIAEKKATFTLKEAVKDSLVDTRKIEFTLENGYIFGPADVDYTATATSGFGYSSSSYAEQAKKRFKELVSNETIKFEEKAEVKLKDGKFDTGFDEDSLSLNIDANGYVTGFSARYAGLKETSDDKVKVTLPVAAPVMAKGEIKVKAGNLFTRSYEKDVEAVIANIKEPISVEIEKAAIKVGKQDQTAGKVTIKETDKGMIERGWMFLSSEDLQAGISFDQLPDIKVTSTDNKALKIENAQISRDKKVIAFEITRTSQEASTIEISNIKFTADRSVPEANYDLQIWGDALTDENKLDVLSNYSTNVLNSNNYRNQYTDMYVVPEFIVMTTKNTQDIDQSGLKAATASFVIGEKKFTVNGESVDMDSAAYIKDNYTMVPVKYVAKAFGIEGDHVQYDQKTSTATITAGNKVISITAGKSFITVNGTQIPMATKAEVNKDNRMCVPMAYIAAALDVQKDWVASTKTATFTNQEEAK